MYQRILVAIDSSRYSELCLDVAMALAEKSGGAVVGFHAYAAQLHEERFRQLETSLPQRYQGPGVLEKQREIHASLIHQGLELISQAYLESCAARCRERGIAFEPRIAEGKNHAEIAREAGQGYDLVLLGANGLGEQEGQTVGSVCLRAVRRLVDVDALVVRDGAPLGGPILVALDGSRCSRRGFGLALSLAKAYGGEVEAVAAYDPEFHNRVFRNLVDVLSGDRGKLFRLQEQEGLHREVIDQGMAKLCQGNLDWAQGLADQEGVTFRGEVIQGKATAAIAHYAQQRRPHLLVAGRFGSHQVQGMDLGSTVEALLLHLPTNLFIASGKARWSPEAEAKLAQVPEGVMRELTRQRVEEMAARQGVRDIAPGLMAAKYAHWAEGSAKAQSELRWSPEASARLERVPPFIRGMVVKSVEGYARLVGVAEVTSELVDEAKAYWERTGTFHL
ncbi:MAG: universal stress protein [Chloroflexi bacterium]|nr:universal stress protein [Chloroflexota bacterium]